MKRPLYPEYVSLSISLSYVFCKSERVIDRNALVGRTIHFKYKHLFGTSLVIRNTSYGQGSSKNGIKAA